MRGSAVIGGAFVLGSLPSLLPYLFVASPATGLRLAIGLSLVFLFLVGVAKGRFTNSNPWRGGLEMVVLGAAVTAISYGVGTWVSSLGGSVAG